jgi:hypothetical protein
MALAHLRVCRTLIRNLNRSHTLRLRRRRLRSTRRWPLRNSCFLRATVATMVTEMEMVTVTPMEMVMDTAMAVTVRRVSDSAASVSRATSCHRSRRRRRTPPPPRLLTRPPFPRSGGALPRWPRARWHRLRARVCSGFMATEEKNSKHIFIVTHFHHTQQTFTSRVIR